MLQETPIGKSCLHLRAPLGYHQKTELGASLHVAALAPHFMQFQAFLSPGSSTTLARPWDAGSSPKAQPTELLRHRMEPEGSTGTGRAAGWESRLDPNVCLPAGELGSWLQGDDMESLCSAGPVSRQLVSWEPEHPFPGRNSQIRANTGGNTITASGTNPATEPLRPHPAPTLVGHREPCQGRGSLPPSQHTFCSVEQHRIQFDHIQSSSFPISGFWSGIGIHPPPLAAGW